METWIRDKSWNEQKDLSHTKWTVAHTGGKLVACKMQWACVCLCVVYIYIYICVCLYVCIFISLLCVQYRKLGARHLHTHVQKRGGLLVVQSSHQEAGSTSLRSSQVQVQHHAPYSGLTRFADKNHPGRGQRFCFFFFSLTLSVKHTKKEEAWSVTLCGSGFTSMQGVDRRVEWQTLF